MSFTTENPTHSQPSPGGDVFEAFVAPARAFPQLWRLVLGLLVIAMTMILLVGLQIGIMFLIVGAAAMPDWLDQFVRALSPRGALLLMLSSFYLPLEHCNECRILDFSS